MNSIFQYFKDIFCGLKNLFAGMRITSYYFFHPRQIVTEQYPENRDKLKMFEAFRGVLTMPHNENNEHKCTACGICEMNCPNGTIEVVSQMVVQEDGKKKRELVSYVYHMGMCTFCNLCVKTCPSKALVFGNEFEHAVFNREKLNKILNKPNSKLMKGVE